MSRAREIAALSALLPDWAWPAPVRFEAQERRSVCAAVPDPFARRFDPPLTAGAGPLTGLRLAVKENYAIAGLPVVAGLIGRWTQPAEAADAPVVAALRAAGADLSGTTKMHELALGVTGLNEREGTPAHPDDPTRLPGGSSSGSAVAVALGAADVALGTDTGGSARIPAALTGVVGYKCSREVPVRGVLPLAPSLDHLGWCTRDVRTSLHVAQVLGLVADPPLPAVSRLGVLRPATETASPVVREAVASALAVLGSAGAELVELEWPHLDATVAVTSTIMFVEAARGLLHHVDECAPDVAARLRRGADTPDTVYRAAVRLGQVLTEHWRAATAGLTAVVAPTTSVQAPFLEEAADPGIVTGLLRTTRLADLTGEPALTLPIPAAGLPVGLHLSAPSDADLLGAAAWVEAEVGRAQSA